MHTQDFRDALTECENISPGEPKSMEWPCIQMIVDAATIVYASTWADRLNRIEVCQGDGFRVFWMSPPHLDVSQCDGLPDAAGSRPWRAP